MSERIRSIEDIRTGDIIMCADDDGVTWHSGHIVRAAPDRDGNLRIAWATYDYRVGMITPAAVDEYLKEGRWLAFQSPMRDAS